MKEYRSKEQISYYFDWDLKIEEEFKFPFIPTHENMLKLNLNRGQPVNELAADLRKAFSGIVAGNVKEFGQQQIAEKGVFKIAGDLELMEKLDVLLQSFVQQKRMKLPGTKYTPVFEVLKEA